MVSIIAPQDGRERMIGTDRNRLERWTYDLFRPWLFQKSKSCETIAPSINIHKNWLIFADQILISTHIISISNTIFASPHTNEEQISTSSHDRHAILNIIIIYKQQAKRQCNRQRSTPFLCQSSPIFMMSHFPSRLHKPSRPSAFQPVRFHNISFICLLNLDLINRQHMLPDSLPVFNIDLDCDFQSSDNLFPPYPSNKTTPGHSSTLIDQSHHLTIFSALGRRNDNLDRCVTLVNDKFTLLCVLDGHCDPHVVNYLQANLLPKLATHPELLTKPECALLQIFEEMEGQVIKKFEKGSTALVALVKEGQLFVANLGDSMLLGVDNSGKLQQFTVMHNLANSTELMQVISKGGIVLKKGEQYRINGQINLSRCLGDKHLKYCMSSTPDLYRLKTNQCSRWVLATDGFHHAKNVEKRVKWQNVNQLRDSKTLYQDNASAIFFDP